MRSSEKNRFQNALTTGNCKLDIVFSDIFGKSASAIVDTILSNNIVIFILVLFNLCYTTSETV